MLMSHDDPFIPFKAYRRYDFSRAPRVGTIVTRCGGHCGFHAPEAVTPWCDRVAADFIHRRRL
jgi:predicted alpha/beta-fold hydrolase